MDLIQVSRSLAEDVDPLQFGQPVAYVYDPLDYARVPHEAYLRKYGAGTREIIMLGINPGPNGMAQTGVPFGDVVMVRDWMGITGPVGKPPREHPKRPVEGFECGCREASGSRLWGWARDRFGAAESFFARFYVANYCPLVFYEEDGANRTPDKLPISERTPLFEACDRALQRTADILQPHYAIGIGSFARKRLEVALGDRNIIFGQIMHPSPSNPRARHGWKEHVDEQLHDLGIL